MQLHIDKALLATGIFDDVKIKKHDDKGVELEVRVRDPQSQEWLNFWRRFMGKGAWLPAYKFTFGNEDETAVAQEVVQQIGVRMNKEILKAGDIPLGLNAFHVGKNPLDMATISEGFFGCSSPSKGRKKFIRAIAAAAKGLKKTKPISRSRRPRKKPGK